MIGKAWQVRQTTLEVHLGHLRENFFHLKKQAAAAELMVLLKSDAYGHSHQEIAIALDSLPKEVGLHGFGVANIEEGIELRRIKVRRPVYILSGLQTMDEDIYRCLQTCTLTPIISSLRVLHEIDSFTRRSSCPLSFHLKINTGMNRLGIDAAEISETISLLQKNTLLRMDGIFSHFSSAEKPTAPITKNQVKQFRAVLSIFRENGFTPRYVHMENSSGLYNHCFPEGNIARVGLHLYGVDNKKLQPVARWSAQVYQTRFLQKGDAVGYGPLFQAKKKMRMAILGVGYGDGYHRALSNRADVLLQGRRCPVIGAISMDLTAVDVSKLSGNLENTRAILMGRDGKEEITAVELAKHAKCIPWEILTSISPRVPRIFTQ